MARGFNRCPKQACDSRNELGISITCRRFVWVFLGRLTYVVRYLTELSLLWYVEDKKV